MTRTRLPGSTSLFIRVLLDKKYTLPYQVLDALVFHFIRISNTHKGRSEALPVLWHQSLLVLCQRCALSLSRYLTSSTDWRIPDTLSTSLRTRRTPYSTSCASTRTLRLALRFAASSLRRMFVGILRRMAWICREGPGLSCWCRTCRSCQRCGDALARCCGAN